jgi:outer membrane murein-binding lipoprotein Lpp
MAQEFSGPIPIDDDEPATTAVPVKAVSVSLLPQLPSLLQEMTLAQQSNGQPNRPALSGVYSSLLQHLPPKHTIAAAAFSTVPTESLITLSAVLEEHVFLATTPEQLELSVSAQLALATLSFDNVAYAATLAVCRMLNAISKATKAYTIEQSVGNVFANRALPSLQDRLLPVLQRLLLLPLATKKWTHAEFLLLFEELLNLPAAMDTPPSMHRKQPSSTARMSGGPIVIPAAPLSTVDQILVLQGRLATPFLATDQEQVRIFHTCLKFVAVLGSPEALRQFRSYFFKEVLPKANDLPFALKMELFTLIGNGLQSKDASSASAGGSTPPSSAELTQLIEALMYNLKNYAKVNPSGAPAAAAAPAPVADTTPKSTSIDDVRAFLTAASKPIKEDLRKLLGPSESGASATSSASEEIDLPDDGAPGSLPPRYAKVIRTLHSKNQELTTSNRDLSSANKELTQTNREWAKQVEESERKMKELLWERNQIRLKTSGQIAQEQSNRIVALEEENARLREDHRKSRARSTATIKGLEDQLAGAQEQLAAVQEDLEATQQERGHFMLYAKHFTKAGELPKELMVDRQLPKEARKVLYVAEIIELATKHAKPAALTASSTTSGGLASPISPARNRSPSPNSRRTSSVGGLPKSPGASSLAPASQAGELRNRFAAQRNEIEGLKKQLTEQEQKNVQAKEDQTKLHATEVDALLAQITSAQAETTAQKSEVVQLQSEIASLKEQLIASTTQLIDREVALTTAKNDLAAREAEIANQTNNNTETLKQSEKQVAELTAQLTKVQADHEAAKAEQSQEHVAALEVSRKKVDALQAELTESQETHRELTARLEQSGKDISAANAKASQLESEKTALDEKLVAAEREAADAKQHLDDLYAEIAGDAPAQ